MNTRENSLSNLFWKLSWHLSKAREYPGVHSLIDDLREDTSLDPEQWQNKLNKRLKNLLSAAKEKVPFYYNLFKENDINLESNDLMNEFRRIPVLTKGIIRNNIDAMINPIVDSKHIFENATGGSTGYPLKFYQDLGYQTIAVALDVYVRKWWGIRPYDRTASIWGADRDFKDLSLKEKFYEWRTRSRSLNAFRMTNEGLVDFCRMLQQWKPPYLMGYSSALETLAYCAKENDIHLEFDAIRSTAETLWPHQKQLIESTFQSPVYNFYGSREVNNLVAECPEGRRLHFISTWRYIEVVDEKGRCVPDGEAGYITVTDLSNFAMPFIRYRNEDIGKISHEPCPCGRPTPVLKELLGRSSDLIKTPDGGIIHGEFFTHLFYGREDILQFQVHQTHHDRIVIHIVPVDKVSDVFIKMISEKIRIHIGDKIKINIEVTNDIPIPPSGKHRFTISDI